MGSNCPSSYSRPSPCHSSATPSPPSEPDAGINFIGSQQYNQGTAHFIPASISAELLNSDSAASSVEEIPVIVEEPWNEQIETHIRAWLAEAKESQTRHRNAGYTLKKRYRILQSLVILWSSVILIGNGFLGCSSDSVDTLVRLLINAIGVFINSIFASLNLGYTYREHFEYETKFFDLAQDIECMLVRQRPYRMPADAFVTEIRERRKKLALAPEVPRGTYPHPRQR